MSHQPADPTRRDPAAPDHPAAERLAALADGEATAAEAAHLTACAPCRRELDAHVRLLGRARLERDRVAPPLSDWGALGSALRADGLVRVPADEPPLAATAAVVGTIAEAAAGRRRRVPVWLGRAAAGLLLAAGGALAGRLSAGAAPLPALPALGGAGDPAAQVAAVLADSASPPTSQAEAIAVLTRAERDYRLATRYLAQQTANGAGDDRPEDYQRRLAVMDEVASLTRAALYEAPHDPVLNQYYLASLSAREATLQQLGTVLPAGSQISRF